MSTLIQLLGSYEKNKNIVAVRDNYNNKWQKKRNCNFLFIQLNWIFSFQSYFKEYAFGTHCRMSNVFSYRCCCSLMKLISRHLVHLAMSMAPMWNYFWQCSNPTVQREEKKDTKNVQIFHILQTIFLKKKLNTFTVHSLAQSVIYGMAKQAIVLHSRVCQ